VHARHSAFKCEPIGKRSRNCATKLSTWTVKPQRLKRAFYRYLQRQSRDAESEEKGRPRKPKPSPPAAFFTRRNHGL
jgi:hypothetical protein